MKRRFLAALIAVVAVILTGCSGSNAADDPHAPLKIGVSPQPHGEILKYVKENLAKQAGIDIKIVQFDDYNRPNEAVANGELDANYFQHKPYLAEYQKKRGGDFAWVGAVHLEPLAVYSKTIKSLRDLPPHAVVALPADPSNRARSLKLLQSNGVIKLRPGAEQNATARDVAENPKGLELKELQADQLPRAIDDAAAAVVNGNYALKANLTNPIAIESAANNPYANGLVTSPKLAHDPRILKLAELLQSPQVKDFINRKYGGVAVVPAN